MSDKQISVIKKLKRQIRVANKMRNFFIVISIILTAFMITSTLSIGMSMFDSMQAQFTRQQGTIAHGGVPYPTPEQLKKLSTLDYIKGYGTRTYMGIVQNQGLLQNLNVSMIYADETLFEFMSETWVDIIGNYPQDANEIMVSQELLKKMGIENPEIGMEIPLSYTPWEEEIIQSRTFILSGTYVNFDYMYAGQEREFYVSEGLAREYGKTSQEHGMVSILFKNKNNVSSEMDRLINDLELTSLQQEGVTVNPVYNINYLEHSNTIFGLALLVVTVILTGYLLVYNVLYISVMKEVRFYGLLKTIGATSKQVKGMVMEQVMELCLLGIPVGLLLGWGISFVLIPMSVISSDSQSEVVISFSPFIYIGATILTLLTVFIGSISPAKKASQISPIEAVKYIGEINGKGYRRKLTQGKLHRIAFRNIFRDRKRTNLTLCSLSLGVLTFISTRMIVSSLNMERYADMLVDNDIVLVNEAYRTRVELFNVFNDDLIEEIQSLQGVKNVQIFTQKPIELNYTSVWDAHIEKALKEVEPYIKDYGIQIQKEDYFDYFTGLVIGINEATIQSWNEAQNGIIDIEGFERGEFALITTDYPELYANVNEIEAKIESNDRYFVIPLGGFVPQKIIKSPYSQELTIYVSQSFLDEVSESPIISDIHLEVEDEYEAYVLESVKDRVGNNFDIFIWSKLELREELRDSKLILYIMGSSLSIILGLIGILNFVISMATGILARKQEFAILESIGMTKKQLRKVLIYEGLWYAVITLILAGIFGNGISISLYKLVEQSWGEFMSFNYPFVSVLITAVVILATCMIIPEIAYRSVNKLSIVERLQEVE